MISNQVLYYKDSASLLTVTVNTINKPTKISESAMLRHLKAGTKPAPKTLCTTNNGQVKYKCSVHTYLRSMRSFSQLPIKVPNWHDWTWSCNVSKNRSLNWNVLGNCCANCQVQSINWVNTGDTSFGSPATWPHRSLNLWPNASQSFSIRACGTNYMFPIIKCDLNPASLMFPRSFTTS